MSARWVLAIDQGTTGSTVLIVDIAAPGGARVISQATVEFPQHYPKTGWVEHDLEDIWHSVHNAARQAMERAAAATPGFAASKLTAIGITNQRETLCFFERKTGKPVARAIVWQDKRSTDICKRMKDAGLEPGFRQRTGLLLDPYFTGTKISWVMENVPELAAKVKSGSVVMGTIDTYLMARLSSGDAFVTEASNASRTLCYDLAQGGWNRELLAELKVPSPDALPEVRDSAGLFGKTRGAGFLPDGIPITGALGDQQAALAGQACYEVGEAKCTYGTGAFLLLNIGDEAVASRSGLLTTVAWSLKGRLTYAFEGSAFVAGAAVQFLRDQFGLISASAETEGLARDAVAAPEVYFLPALAGLGAPYWDPRAQGAFLGLTRGTTKAQIVRAALEGIAFQVVDLIDSMRRDAGRDVSVLRVDGGAAANDLLMQTQADFARITVDRPANLETTALGAALFAGLGAGVYGSLAELKSARKPQRLFEPGEHDVASKLAGWKRAIKAVQVFAGTM
jgi:glycerol kinase